jgi:hypothetical protein
MARPKSKDSRRTKAEKRRAARAAEAAARLVDKGTPNDHVQRRRAAFSFLGSGMIDRDIRDAVGQLHALGYLDGHGHDAKNLRDIGWEYADMYWDRYQATAPVTGSFERIPRGTGNPPPRTASYDRFDKLDEALPRVSMERTALHMLLTEHYHSDAMTGWAQRLVNLELAKRGVPDVVVVFDGMTEGHDRYMLNAAIRGLCLIYDASLAPRGIRWAA